MSRKQCISIQTIKVMMLKVGYCKGPSTPSGGPLIPKGPPGVESLFLFVFLYFFFCISFLRIFVFFVVFDLLCFIVFITATINFVTS